MRSSALPNKARLAVELMSMDREVISLSHQLGVRPGPQFPLVAEAVNSELLSEVC